MNHDSIFFQALLLDSKFKRINLDALCKYPGKLFSIAPNKQGEVEKAILINLLNGLVFVFVEFSFLLSSSGIKHQRLFFIPRSPVFEQFYELPYNSSVKDNKREIKIKNIKDNILFTRVLVCTTLCVITM